MEEKVKNLCAPIPLGFTAGCGRSRRYPEKHWASIWLVDPNILRQSEGGNYDERRQENGGIPGARRAVRAI